MEENINKAEEDLRSIETELATPQAQSDPQRLTELFQKLHDSQQSPEKLFSQRVELEELNKK